MAIQAVSKKQSHTTAPLESAQPRTHTSQIYMVKKSSTGLGITATVTAAVTPVMDRIGNGSRNPQYKYAVATCGGGLTTRSVSIEQQGRVGQCIGITERNGYMRK